MSATVLTLLALCSGALPSAPQDPEDVLARYVLEGAPATVTRADVALEMAYHLRRRERGRQACDVLVDALLTRREAEKHGLMPTEAEVRAFWRELQDQLRAAGRQPEEFAAVRNTGEAQWLRDLSVQLAQERLVRRELGLGPDAKVTGDMLRLWLAEARERASVRTDPDRLPAGVAAKVGDTSVPLVELGFLLLRTSEDFERDRFLRQIVYLESLEALGEKHGVSVTPADLDAAVERRRREASRDPRFAGVSFENLLEAQGLTVAALRELRVFRAQVLLDELALVLFPDDDLRDELERDRQRVLDEVGPRRRIGVIFVRALVDPNALIVRSFEQAKQHLEAVRRRIAADGFAATASIESEDGDSKQRGGDVGWHRRSSDQLPEPVLKAAFALDVAEVSMPIEADDGCYLVTVLDREPVPDDAELVRRLRELRARELGESLLRDAEVEIVAGQAR